MKPIEAYNVAEPSSLRLLLRNSTASLHARVDARMSQLLRQPGGYARFIATTAATILPLESVLEEAHVSELLPDWEQRSRATALRSDMAALSLAEPIGQISLPRRDDAYLFGILYVLEGSRLGSRVILRNLQNSPAVTRVAISYLSHGQERRFWQTFLDRLESSPATKRNPDLTVAGASAAFQMFLANDEIQCVR